MQMTLQKWQMLQQLYVYDGIISHEIFFGLLCDIMKLKIEDVCCSISGITEEMILNSKDPAFNDIPLSKWDSLDVGIRLRAAYHFPAWSSSNTVCCAKQIARRYKESHNVSQS